MVSKHLVSLCTSVLSIHVTDLKESVEYLSKKYGDKEKDHVTLVRAFSSATEKVHHTSMQIWIILFSRLLKWRKKRKTRCWLRRELLKDYKKVARK